MSSLDIARQAYVEARKNQKAAAEAKRQADAALMNAARRYRLALREAASVTAEG